jgi:hypothetical protein
MTNTVSGDGLAITRRIIGEIKFILPTGCPYQSRRNKGEKMRVTIKQLEDTIKAKDLLIHVLATHVNRKNKTIQRQTARIKVLGKALTALEKDYESLKRKKK